MSRKSTALLSWAMPSPLIAYVIKETADSGNQSLYGCSESGRYRKAKSLYAPTRPSTTGALKAGAGLFSDLDSGIDAREDDYGQKRPSKIHRLPPSGDPVWRCSTKERDGSNTDQLNSDVLELQKRISELAASPPSKVVGGAAGLIEEVAASKISGEERSLQPH